MRNLLISISIVLFSGIVFAACPSADLTGDCKVNFDDFAMMASGWLTTYNVNDLADMAAEWLINGFPEDPASMVWVSINEPGFTGEMSKYETTNAQYHQFLNEALESNDITVGVDNIVYGANGSNSGADFVDFPYFETYAASSYSQIAYSNGTFSIRSRDGYDMSNHPVIEVSYNGARAFCNYYGYSLPSQSQWQAVADYDGSYIYGCGVTIDHSKANYDNDNPLSLSSTPYTSPVNYYPFYGYGVNDMAGNVWEWTNTTYYLSLKLCSGSWGNIADYSEVSSWYTYPPEHSSYGVGFRVCR